MPQSDAPEQRRGAASSAAPSAVSSALRATADVETREQAEHIQQERRGRLPRGLARYEASAPLPKAGPWLPAGVGRQQHTYTHTHTHSPAPQRADKGGNNAAMVPLEAQAARGLAGNSHAGRSGLRDLVQRQAALTRVAGKMKRLELSLPGAPMPSSSAMSPHRQFPVMVPAFARVDHGS